MKPFNPADYFRAMAVQENAVSITAAAILGYEPVLVVHDEVQYVGAVRSVTREELQREFEQVRAAPQALRSVAEIRQSIKELERHGDDDTCMCGDSYSRHADAFNAGHSPTNAYSYYMGQLEEELSLAMRREGIVQEWIGTLDEREKKELAERAMSVTRSLCGG